MRSPNPRLQQLRNGESSANGSTELILNYLDTPGNAGEHLQDTKDATGLDWYVEGPGRRVGYDDLTAIDWIFEYAKERQRLRYLYSSASGILGHLKQLADASQVWIILVAAGILSGAIAAFIDITSDWLGDLKTGYCSDVDGDGKFYLNKSFCCWGHSELSACHDWHPWGNALGIGPVGGRWVVEYIFFVLFSVSETSYEHTQHELTMCRYCSPHAQVFLSVSFLHTQSIAVYPRSRQCWVASSYGIS